MDIVKSRVNKPEEIEFMANHTMQLVEYKGAKVFVDAITMTLITRFSELRKVKRGWMTGYFGGDFLVHKLDGHSISHMSEEKLKSFIESDLMKVHTKSPFDPEMNK